MVMVEVKSHVSPFCNFLNSLQTCTPCCWHGVDLSHCPALTVPLPVIHAHDYSPWGKLSGAAQATPIMSDQTEIEERYLAEATLIEVLLCVKPSTKHFPLQ